MNRCPVCGKETAGLMCRNCGFDGSCNYERYPSLGNLPRATESVNARRAALAEQEKNVIHCPFCGSTSLAVEVTLQCTCNDCRQRFSLVFPQDDFVPEPDLPTPDPQPVPDKFPHGKLAAWTALFGFISEFLYLIMLFFLPDSAEPSIFLARFSFLMISGLFGILVALKGFSCVPFLKKLWKYADIVESNEPPLPQDATIFLILPALLRIIVKCFTGVSAWALFRGPLYLCRFLGFGGAASTLYQLVTGTSALTSYSGFHFVLLWLGAFSFLLFVGLCSHGYIRELKK